MAPIGSNQPQGRLRLPIGQDAFHSQSPAVGEPLNSIPAEFAAGELKTVETFGVHVEDPEFRVSEAITHICDAASIGRHSRRAVEDLAAFVGATRVRWPRAES